MAATVLNSPRAVAMSIPVTFAAAGKAKAPNRIPLKKLVARALHRFGNSSSAFPVQFRGRMGSDVHFTVIVGRRTSCTDTEHKRITGRSVNLALS
jgi:hypothetical protein